MAEEPHVVIIGAGFGGLSAAKELGNTGLSVTIIDKNNYHLFQPLLYQVATAGLSPAEIATPIRHILHRHRNIRVLMNEVVGIDRANRVVHLKDTREGALRYDYLVIATGATHSYFKHPEWQSVAPGLKTLEEATDIRRNILLAFEKAEMEQDPAVREKLLTFVIVGGGPTGVEMAGAIAELAQRVLASDFRSIHSNQARIILVEGGERVLGTFPESLSRNARLVLERMHVRVLTGQPVTDVRADRVTVGSETIATATVIWAAGVKATPVATWLGVEGDRGGRIAVNSALQLPGEESIYVIGDVAAALATNGKPLPAVAPVAMQQGRFVARHIRERARGSRPREGFRYRDKGSLATIGRSKAVAAMGWLNMAGRIAWYLWLFVHIMYLVGFKNRLFVLMQWAWSYTTSQRGARLITHKH